MSSSILFNPSLISICIFAGDEILVASESLSKSKTLSLPIDILLFC